MEPPSGTRSSSSSTRLSGGLYTDMGSEKADTLGVSSTPCSRLFARVWESASSTFSRNAMSSAFKFSGKSIRERLDLVAHR